jgi:uncharacterized protein
MRGAFALLAAGALGLCAAAVARADVIPPSPTRWVTDNASFISDATRQTLDDRLAQFNRATGHQVIVWIGDTTGDVPLEDWTIQAFTKWKVGRKGLDDGLALFVFARDRKLRIEVGYGLEDKVPDAVASRIIRDTIVPLVRAGKHDEAITAGVDQIIAAISGTLPQQPRATQPGSAGAIAFGLFALAFAAFWLFGVLVIVRRGLHAGWAAYTIGSGYSGFWSGGGFFPGGSSGGIGGGLDSGGFSGGGGSGGGGGASGGW